MALVPSQLIDRARDFHESFSPKEIPVPMLLRQLTRLERRIYQSVHRLNDEALADVQVIGQPLIEQSLDGTGLDLVQHYRVLAVFLRDNEHPQTPDIKVSIVPQHNRMNVKHRHPVGYLLGQKLFLLPLTTWGFTDQTGYETAKEVRVVHVPVPPDITSVSQALKVPDAAEEVLTNGLVLFMAGRKGLLDQIPLTMEEAKEQEESLISTLAFQDSASSWHVGES